MAKDKLIVLVELDKELVEDLGFSGGELLGTELYNGLLQDQAQATLEQALVMRPGAVVTNDPKVEWEFGVYGGADDLLPGRFVTRPWSEASIVRFRFVWDCAVPEGQIRCPACRMWWRPTDRRRKYDDECKRKRVRKWM